MYVPIPTQPAFGSRSQSLSGYSRSPRRRRSLSGLGDDAAILNQVFAGITGAPAATLVRNTVQQAMALERLTTAENCTGIVTPGKSTAQLITTTSGTAAVSWATTAIAAGASGPLAPIVLAVGGIMQLFGSIFGHHAAKVKQEQQVICAVVQSVNDALGVLDQAVQQRMISPQDAATSLDGLYAQVQQAVQPILKQDSSHCNAACFELAMCRGVFAKKKAEYQAMVPPPLPPTPAPTVTTTPGATATSTPSVFGQANSFVDNLAGSTGLPAVVIWGLGALVGAKILGVF